MKRVLFILCSIPLLLFSPVSFANAQETSDFSKLNPEDYTNISLPPLDLLFENAKGGPIYELASVKEQIERKLLAKERRAVLSFFNIREVINGESSVTTIHLPMFQHLFYIIILLPNSRHTL